MVTDPSPKLSHSLVAEPGVPADDPVETRHDGSTVAPTPRFVVVVAAPARVSAQFRARTKSASGRQATPGRRSMRLPNDDAAWVKRDTSKAAVLRFEHAAFALASADFGLLQNGPPPGMQLNAGMLVQRGRVKVVPPAERLHDLELLEGSTDRMW